MGRQEALKASVEAKVLGANILGQAKGDSGLAARMALEAARWLWGVDADGRDESEPVRLSEVMGLADEAHQALRGLMMALAEAGVVVTGPRDGEGPTVELPAGDASALKEAQERIAGLTQALDHEVRQANEARDLLRAALKRAEEAEARERALLSRLEAASKPGLPVPGVPAGAQVSPALAAWMAKKAGGAN